MLSEKGGDKKSAPLFTAAAFYLVRKPVLPIDCFFNLMEEKEGVSEKLFHFYKTTSLFREAISVASPSLFKALEKASPSEASLVSLLKYFIRMTSRPTPFGLFSSVSIGTWGQNAAAYFDSEKMKTRSRPDMSWLSAVIDQICSQPSFFLTLSVQQNLLVKKTKNRLAIDRLNKGEGKKAISIRRTPLTEAIFALTQQPIQVDNLIERLLNQIPTLISEKVEEVIQTLLHQEFLHFSLFPSLLTAAPFPEFLSKLTPEQLSFFQGLEIEKKYQVDSFEPGNTATLPPPVAEQVAEAADVLMKIVFDPDPLGLSDYHRLFIEKYGMNRLVPLLELLCEESGLGIPLVYKEPPTPKAETAEEKAFRTQLRRAYAKCLHEGKQEIEITELVESSLSKRVQPSIDLFFEIIADSAEAVEKGDFLLFNATQTRQGGSTFGRFLDLFDDSFQEEFRRFIEKEENLDPEVDFIDSSYLPPILATQNVAIHPPFRKKIIDLSPSTKSNCFLEHIFVGSEADRLFLTSRDGERELYVTAGNVVNPTYAPPLLQFLRDVSKGQHRLVNSFYWKELDGMPFLPRVRHQKIILSPALWNVDKKELGSSTFTAWADAWKMPRYIFLADLDQKLLLDRSQPLVLRLIETEISKGKMVRFEEKIGQEKGQWMTSQRGKHMAEFVFPLLRTEKQLRQRKKIRYTPVPPNQRWKLPGSEWLFVKLYLSQTEEARFLTQTLSPFADFLVEQNIIQKWFFIRYKDQKSHIRVRFYGEKEKMATSLFRYLERWTSQMLNEGLVQDVAFASYEREIERYGGEALIEGVEHFFCCDSQTTLVLLQQKLTLPDYAIGALSLLDLLPGSLEERSLFFETYPVEREYLENFRKWKTPLLSIAESILEGSLTDKRADLHRAFTLRKEALQPIYARSQPSLLDSLVHMHCNRLFGIDRKLERKARAYAAHILYCLKERATKKLS